MFYRAIATEHILSGSSNLLLWSSTNNCNTIYPDVNWILLLDHKFKFREYNTSKRSFVGQAIANLDERVLLVSLPVEVQQPKGRTNKKERLFIRYNTAYTLTHSSSSLIFPLFLYDLFHFSVLSSRLPLLSALSFTLTELRFHNP